MTISLETAENILEKLSAKGADFFSVRQLRVIMALRAGQKTVRGLAEQLRTNKPAVSRAMDKFEELGWVERKVDPEDRRSVFLSLTKDGKKFVGNFS